MKQLFLSMFCAAILIACESQVNINVTCKDAETLQPLSDVQVNVNAGLDGDYNKSTDEGKTDGEGNFETSIMIGCPGKCYDIYMTYTKDGYQTKKDLNITEGEVLLEKVISDQ